MDLRTQLDVIYSDGGTETNYSADAQDFKRDNFAITLTTDDFIYIGYHKPINALYVAMATANTNSTSLSVEYYGESLWTALTVSDDTRGFSRNGFITWERPDDPADLTVAGLERCWIRIAVNDDSSAINFQAINLVFSDDNDICQEVPALDDACFYPAGQTNHLIQHVAAKNYIMSRLRSLGYVKYDSNGEQNINEWDILDIFEMRQASTYYTISQIYFNLSDDPDDQYWAKYKEYDKKFEEAFALGRLRVDLDDDGQVDTNEKRPRNAIRWSR